MIAMWVVSETNFLQVVRFGGAIAILKYELNIMGYTQAIKKVFKDWSHI